MNFGKFLRNPIVVFSAMGVGVLIGIYFPSLALNLGNFGDIYLLLIQMTIIPILVSAIIASVGRFIQDPTMQKITMYAFVVVLVLMISIIIISLVIGFAFNPGNIPVEQARILSEYIGTQANVLNFNLSTASQDTVQDGFLVQFLKIIIPGNISEAFVNANALALAFVSIIMGVAAGLIHTKEGGEDQGDVVIVFFESIFKIFQMLVKWILTALPLGLICIISFQTVSMGFTVINATMRLIATFYILSLILLVLNSVGTGIFIRKSPLRVFSASFYPTLVGFTTKNSIATISPSIHALNTKLGVSINFGRLFTPLSIVLARYGNLAYFGVVSVFVVQLYGISLNFIEILILALGLLFAGLATAGASGFATLSVISIAFLPLGLPVETILLILYAIDPIIDPMRTVLIVNTNFCAVAAIHSKKLGNNRKLKEVSSYSKNIE